MIYDCAIIGAGPAGITSAIQLKRAGFTITLFEKKKIGGLAPNAHHIENYLGFREGISGRKLTSLFVRQLKLWKIPVVVAEVTNITKKNFFYIYTPQKKYKARSVILATGTIPLEANIPGEKELSGEKVFYEVTDLLSKSRSNKSAVAIIGGGDVGFDYALRLIEKKYQPRIITSHKIKCLDLLKQRVKKKKIPCLENIQIRSIKSNKHKVEVICRGIKFIVDYVLIAIGRKPSLPLIKVVNRDGLFMAGDLFSYPLRKAFI